MLLKDSGLVQKVYGSGGASDLGSRECQGGWREADGFRVYEAAEIDRTW